MHASQALTLLIRLAECREHLVILQRTEDQTIFSLDRSNILAEVLIGVNYFS